MKIKISSVRESQLGSKPLLMSLKVMSTRERGHPGNFVQEWRRVWSAINHPSSSLDITYLNKTEVTPKNTRLTPQGLVLQGQEQQASEEGSAQASLETIPDSQGSGQPGRQKRSAESTGPMEDHNWPPYFRDPCDPNPCQNDGLCVNVKGMASCR